MYQKLLALTLLLLARACVQAQEPVNTGSVQDIYNHISSVLAKAESIDFHATHHLRNTEVNEQFLHRPSGSVPGGFDADIHFEGRGEKYLFTEKYVGLLNKNVRAEDLAWDGKYYQVLRRRTNYLLLSRNDPDHNHLDIGAYNALHMFGFLMPQALSGHPTISWELAKNLAAWKNILAGARLIGPETFHGKPCSVIKISSQVYQSMHIPRCTYTIYFSWNDGMFPVAWKVEDENGRVLEDYEIEEFGQQPMGDGYVFYYPKKAKGTFYPNQGFPPGQPRAIYTSQFDSVILNSIKNDDIFTIDPAEANELYDADKNVVMAVPK